jgi:hypothetical protein
MSNNLVITSVGDSTIYEKWIKGNKNFDFYAMYYGDDEYYKNKLKECSDIFISGDFYKKSPSKYHKFDYAIKEYPNILNYDYIWFPDDDININTGEINKLFEIAQKYDLWLCQPSLKGYVSHNITKPVENSILRYTNFVEVMSPLFSKYSLMKLLNTFTMNETSWGIDYMWNHLLESPKNKIAIIDIISMEHTKKVSINYSRFTKNPYEEMEYILNKYKLNKIKKEYDRIDRNNNTI